MALVGILQNIVNPSLAPTQPEGSELPTFSYGDEGIPRVLIQYRFLRMDISSQYGEVYQTQSIRETHICTIGLDHH